MDNADWDQTVVGQSVGQPVFSANEDWSAATEDWNKGSGSAVPAQDWNAAGGQAAWNA